MAVAAAGPHPSARCAARVEAPAGGDRVQPGAQRAAFLGEPADALPGGQHRLLDGVLGVGDGAEHPVAVHLQLPPVRPGSAPGTPRHLRPVPGRADRLSPSCAPFLPRHLALPSGTYTARGANWAARGRPVSRRRGVCITDRPDDPSAGSCRGSGEQPWKVDDGIVRIGRARGVRRSGSAPLAGARAAVRGVFMVLLDGTITIVALPSIGAGLSFQR